MCQRWQEIRRSQLRSLHLVLSAANCTLLLFLFGVSRKWVLTFIFWVCYRFLVTISLNSFSPQHSCTPFVHHSSPYHRALTTPHLFFFFGAGQNSTFATKELIQGWVDGSAFSHLPHQSRDTGKHSGQTCRQQSERGNCEVSATYI